MNAAPQELRRQEEALAGFRLSLLGGFALSDPGGNAVAITSKKNRALLAILALSPGQSMTRERLASLLWGDRGEEQARNSLRQSLAVLRKELGPDGSDLIRSQDETLKLAAIAVDVLEIVAGATSNDIADLRASAARCSGDLLADVAIHEESFEEWLAVERSSFGASRFRLFERLAELETGQAKVAAAQHLVALDPLRES
jgi:DNA-binding SARP family transcriptional activator